MAPTFTSPVVAVMPTAAALLPTPSRLFAPVVVMAWRVTLPWAVTLTTPDAVPVSPSAVVTMLAPAMAVTSPLVAVRLTRPPLVRIGSFRVIEVPVTDTVPLAWPALPAVPLMTLPLAESRVTAPVLLSPRVIAPPAEADTTFTAPVMWAREMAPRPSADTLVSPPACTLPV